MSVIHLHIKSCYSLLNSSVRFSSLIERAKAFGMTALTLTDENVMYGAIDFYKSCEKAGIKPIIGLTLSVSEKDEGKSGSYPIILLAKNNQGYTNLMKLSSIVQTKSLDGVPKRWLRHYTNGLIGILSATESELALEEEATSTEFLEMFEKDSVYLGVDRNSGESYQKSEETRMRHSDLPLVAISKVHYLFKEDAFVYECLRNIKQGTKLESLPKESSDYFRDQTELVGLFEDIPEALENTLKVSSQCHVSFEFGNAALPRYPVPNEKSADVYLDSICWEGLEKRVGNVTPEYKARLTYELKVIKGMKFSDYFLIVWDFMLFAKNAGILTGPGRGSAAGSLVAYSLNITDVDPIEHDLLFERFLNPERITMPDIDIDFQDNKRDEVIKYVAQKYGELHVAQIITFGTLAAKAAWRDVAKVLNLSGKEIEMISKMIPTRPGITLQGALKENDKLQKAINETVERQQAFKTAQKIEGLPRHTSTHAAGVVITEKPLTELIPIQAGHEDIYLTQFPMETLEELGLLKMDFLGLRNLTMIQNIRYLIKKETKQKIVNEVPYNDMSTFRLLSEGDTSGIFQLESPGMRKVLTKLKPTNLEDIVAVNALYRPGPMEQIPTFIDRKHGKQKVKYLHPDLIPILEKTFGVIVYQEQIMQIAAVMAGFSLGEADLLRRAVSKKKKEVLDKERTHFVNGCMNKGYEQEIANAVYDLIVRFADYGFNRSHAVAYSFIAYELAYLKATYPKLFMSTLLSSVMGHEQKLSQYINEAKRKGIKILPPSINNSGIGFSVEKEGIRFSLLTIKGIGVQVIKSLVDERKNKAFEDLFDFCKRMADKVNRKTMEMLIYSGSLDEFGEDRATLLATLDVALQHAELMKPAEDNQIDFFLEEEFNIKPKYVKVESLHPMEQLQLEKEALGFYLSKHPTEPYYDYFQVGGAKLIGDLASKDRKKVKIGIFITNERVIRTRKGDLMAFLTFSDSSGEIEAVAFPDVYSRFSPLLQSGETLLVEGNVEEREGKTQLIIKQVEASKTVKEKYASLVGNLFLQINEEVHETEVMEQLQKVLRQYYGPSPVYVHYIQSKRTIKLQPSFFVTPTEECLNKLKTLLGEGNVVFKNSLQ
ncbi:DNA polymerase III subunit alpha [Sutcliffiella rhizosphaerae]|uniref:DNA polymerase III subunit alpha n=1 Tax=Sutcliffiella rhizosphaerae TaxID=2880967 RepID=A0ABM8YIC8_9BACI|nr:DNA polymerase III subunit alpha [Sutcliffiella rhizosphaerae]CAG9619617.1 DNA polymerase III subunit alpha [Sutcliffiella rhizosphaerae]